MKRLVAAGATLAAACVVACNDTPSTPQQQATTLYFYAIYPNPNVTVSVNGTSLGQITKQYTGGNDCGTLLTRNNLDGVLSTTVRLGQHYAFTFNYSSGATDADSLAVDNDIASFPCLFETIDTPSGG